MPFCVIYTRVSSELQDKDTSLNAQEQELRAQAAKDGYTVYEVFSDSAETGRLFERPAFQRMMTLSKQSPPPFKRVYLWDIRRFGRDRIQSGVFKQRLRSRGIEIVYYKENIEDSTTGRLVEGIMESIAEYESYNIAEDTRRGHREITRRGFYHGGAPPFGYKIKIVYDNGVERKTFEPDPQKCHHVAWMYEQKASGESPGAIARKLNQMSITASRGGPWNRASVERILTNSVYIGRFEYGRQSVTITDGKRKRLNNDKDNWTVCENAVEPIVDRNLWETVQNLMKKRPRNGNTRVEKQVYLLSGSLFCSECGGAMIGLHKNGQRKHHRYYYCRKHKSQGNCIKETQEAEALENKVLEVVEKKLKSVSMDKIIEEYQKQQRKNQDWRTHEIEERKKELSRIQNGMENLMNAIQDGFTMPEMKERLTQLSANKELITTEIREIEKSNFLEEALEKESLSLYLNDLGDLVKAGRNKAPEELQEMLRHFIRVTYNAHTKEGTIAILLPQENEKPLTFSVSDSKWFLKSNRSGLTRSETTMKWKIVIRHTDDKYYVLRKHKRHQRRSQSADQLAG